MDIVEEAASGTAAPQTFADLHSRFSPDISVTNAWLWAEIWGFPCHLTGFASVRPRAQVHLANREITSEAKHDLRWWLMYYAGISQSPEKWLSR